MKVAEAANGHQAETDRQEQTVLSIQRQGGKKSEESTVDSHGTIRR
jgi:hypothetical protein